MLASRFPQTLLIVASVGTVANAQTVPWDVFLDTESDSVCDVVNAENAELVVLSDTGELVIVTGRDVTLRDTMVTFEGDVLYLGEPAGFIAYDTDGDGFRTVWWVSLTGRVVSVDGFTGEPTETNLVPGDFFDVPCDACEFWDGPSVCDPPAPPEPPLIIDFCGTNTALAMSMTFVGLITTGVVRRRSV